MSRFLRPLVVFGVASVASVAAFTLTGGANANPSASGPIVDAYAAGGGAYGNLAELELLESTLYYVEESYVDSSRVDYNDMYAAALRAVERRVPVTMFRREPGGTLVHVEVGATRTVLDVPKIQTRKDLQRELQRVAELLQQNLTAADIPMGEDEVGDPFAQIEYAMVNGTLGTLDPHSRLLPPEASKEMDVDNQGEFGGLGITIMDDRGRLKVEYPLPGTPADKEGILADDQIVRIDGVSTINMSLDEAVSRLRGPIGTPVTIEIAREGASDPIEKTIVRARIELKPVDGRLLDGNIGYLVVPGFHAQVAAQASAELAEMERESGGLKGLILDLRDNPGGFLTQAQKLSDMFLDHGVIVSQVDASGRKIEEFSARATGTEPKYPIAVLVNASSASASEIVSGALRNNERAVIIGERTYGKGSVQNLHAFADDSKLKLTISKYLTPGDKSIQAVGIPADIELIPSIVCEGVACRPPSTENDGDANDDGKADRTALLYYRERVHREADADKHLEQATIRLEEPAYSMRYLRAVQLERRKTAEIDLSKDFEVQFARDVLLAAHGSRRADVLASAAPVVAKYQKEGDTSLAAAFTTFGLDWTTGPAVQKADLDVKFDLGADGVIVAGEEENVVLEVTNRGTAPISRLSAIATFEGDYSPREFFFGKLAPGETRRYEQPVALNVGHPTELAPVQFSFRDVSGVEIAHRQARLPVQGQALPRMVWQAALSDVAPGGDGDGIPEVGEKLTVGISVTNKGLGPTHDAFMRIKNESGRAVDITRGTAEPGIVRTKDGAACAVEQAGVDGGNVVGDAKDPRVLKGDPPKYATGCVRSLKPGETWTGSLEVLIKEAPEGGVEKIQFELGDATAYDHASIVRSEFWTYFTQHEDIEFSAGKPFTVPAVGVPPIIAVTNAPEITVDRDHVSVSGVVTDDSGLAHIEVWNAGEKVFYEGGTRGSVVKSVPFTADLTLKPGLNTVTVLATDDQGFTATQSVVTFWMAPDLASAAVVSTGPAPTLHRVP